MANELNLRLSPGQTGLTIVARLRQPGGNQQGSDIATAENGTAAGFYSASVPGATPANVYTVDFFDTINIRLVGVGELHWNGTEELTIEDAVDDIAAASAAILAAIAALDDLSSAQVQSAVTAALNAQGFTVALATELDGLDPKVTTVLAGVERIRKITGNKVVVSVDELTVTVYEDDEVTPAFTFTISADKLTRDPN